MEEVALKLSGKPPLSVSCSFVNPIRRRQLLHPNGIDPESDYRAKWGISIGQILLAGLIYRSTS